MQIRPEILHMPIYQAVILAIIQGLTEFLPISSSAHLALAPWLFGWQDPGLTFDIALHLGTLLAIVFYFFRDWIQIIANGMGVRLHGDPELGRNPKLLWYLVAGTIPVGIAGLLFNKQAETTWRHPAVIATMLISVAVVMIAAEKMSRPHKKLDEITASDAGVIGLAQALAVVPGTSRSGITIAAGLFRNIDRATAARFSFLLSTPAIAAAAAKSSWDLLKHGGIPADMRLPFIIGIIVSALSGAVVIAFLLDYLRRHGLWVFIYYRIIFGIIVIALATFFRYTGG
jgi:undecaprenyl-diphosphatase